jgi:hypothetical protein
MRKGTAEKMTEGTKEGGRVKEGRKEGRKAGHL